MNNLNDALLMLLSAALTNPRQISELTCKLNVTLVLMTLRLAHFTKLAQR